MRLAALLCAVVMTLGLAPPAATAQSEGLGYDLHQVPMGWTDLGRQILEFRSHNPDISHRRNVAIFEYKQDGVRISVVGVSVPAEGKEVQIGIFRDGVYDRTESIPVDEFRDRYGVEPLNKHSEQIVHAYLSEAERALVTRGESELQPCLLAANQCRFRLRRDWYPKIGTMRYHGEYGEGKKQRREAVDGLEARLDQWVSNGRSLDPQALAGLFTPPGQAPPLGGVVNTLSGAPGNNPGGIDLTSLELRYLADPPPGADQGLRFAFDAPPTDADPNTAAGQAAALQASDAFFVWLSLHPSTFWVNLNPDEPDRIVDQQLGTTDVGRILLESDLQMKKTTAELIHPATDLGKRYWNELDTGDGDQFCAANRLWIVAAPATVYEQDGELYILEAPISVQMESSYLAGQDIPDRDCPGVSERVQQHNESVFQSLILPEVEEAVNEAPEYEELRRVYLSRVAAEWYRDRDTAFPTMFGDLIDSGDVSDWPARTDWSPRKVFDRYVKSYTEGEFEYTVETQHGNVIETITYTYGGVDLFEVPYDGLSAEQFSSGYQDLPATVAASLETTATDQDGQIWLGSVTAPRPIAGPSGDPPSTTDRLRGLIVVGVLTAVFLIVVTMVLVLVLVLALRSRPRG